MSMPCLATDSTKHVPQLLNVRAEPLPLLAEPLRTHAGDASPRGGDGWYLTRSALSRVAGRV